MKYRITDTARPDEELILELAEPEDWYDEDQPEADEQQAGTLLNWWSDPRGRGFMPIEDDDRIVIVDATSGEPTIETWSADNDDAYLLEYFPFPTLSYEPINEGETRE